MSADSSLSNSLHQECASNNVCLRQVPKHATCFRCLGSYYYCLRQSRICHCWRLKICLCTRMSVFVSVSVIVGTLPFVASCKCIDL